MTIKQTNEAMNAIAPRCSQARFDWARIGAYTAIALFCGAVWGLVLAWLL